MKRLIALFLSLTMLLSLCPINIWAEELTAKDQQVYIAEDTSADDLSGDDSAVESESQTEDEQNSTDDEVVVEDSSASAPSEEEETPSEGEDETAENGEAEFGFESITVSTPVANAAATTHSHPQCGKYCSCSSSSHPRVTWNAWDGTTTLGGGNYYLTKDVVLSKTMILDYNYITLLCLNGHSITCEDTVFDIYSLRSLYITDCVGTGVVETDSSNPTIKNNRLLSIWGGTIRNASEVSSSNVIKTYKNTNTYVRGGTVESLNGNAIYTYPGSKIEVSGGNIQAYYYAISGQDDTTETISTLTISGGHISSTQAYVTLDIQNGSLTMSGGYVDGDIYVPDTLGTTTISGGTINGLLDTYSGNTIVKGGEMEIDASGNTEIYAGTFRGNNYFRGENTSIFGGNFSNTSVVGVYGKTWICGGSFNVLQVAGNTPLYLSGVPEISTIRLITNPPVISAQSEDGSSSYGGDPIELYFWNPYTSTPVVLEDGDIVVKNVKSDTVADKFVLAEDGTGKYLERSGNNLVLCIPPSGTWGDNAISWRLIDGTLTISGTGALSSADSGTKYPWGSYLDEITKIVVEPGITSIPNFAFEYCENATAISLPETLTSLNLNAFNDCGSLNNLLLPSSLTSISGFSNTGYPAFIRCESLTDLYYLGTAEEWDALRDGDCITSSDNNMTIHFLQLNSTAPTCTEAGKQYYAFDNTSVYAGMYGMDKQPISQAETIPALGHRVVLDQAMQVDPIKIENADTIPFVLKNGNYYSNNHTHNSSSQFRIVATHNCTLTLHYGVYSEKNYDKLYIRHNDIQKDAISGNVDNQQLTLTLAAGDIVTVVYKKDSGLSSGNDQGWVSLDYEQVVYEAGSEVSADILNPNCTDAVVCDFCHTTVKEALGHSFDDGVCTVCGYAECIITFNANGGNGTMTAQTVTSGVAATLNANTFTHADFHFAGWNTKADGTGTAYDDKTIITVTTNTTLYAQWISDHSHPDCGTVGCTNTTHGHSEISTWIKLTEADLNSRGTLFLESGKSYYLGEDITVSSAVSLGGKGVVLCLNGKLLKNELGSAIEIPTLSELVVCDCSGSNAGTIRGDREYGINVGYYGELTVNNGTVSGVSAGILVGKIGTNTDYLEGTLTINGGIIVGEQRGIFVQGGDSEVSINGGTVKGLANSGIFAYEETAPATITVNGGTITGIAGDLGAFGTSEAYGIDVGNNNLLLSGSPNISGTTGDIRLNGSTITVADTLTNTTPIGITMTNLGTFAKPDGTNVTTLSEYVGKFASDNADCTVVVDGTDLKLVQNEAHWGLAVDGKAPTTWVGGGTFIDAVTYANTLQSGTAYIQLLSNVNTTYGISFVSGKTTILDLNGHTIDRGLTTGSNANSEVMGGYVLNAVGNLTLCDSSSSDVSKQGKITGGKNASSYGVENRTNCGGGVHVSSSGTFTLAGGNIEGNVAKQGGGVFSLGSFTMTGGAISGNSATYRGGGVCVQEGAFTMSGGTISDNTTKEGAGVDITNGSFTLSGGFISDNTASLYGGGVQGGPFIMTGGTISGNKADQGGGGVDVTASNTFTMEGGTISDNSASWGAGVNLPANGTFIMSGGTITGNTANDHAGVNAAGSFELSGSPVIIGNTIGTGNEAIASNVYQNGDRIVVGTLTAGAAIGVSRSSGIGTFTTGGGNYAAYFTSDNADYIVANDGKGNLMLVYPTLTGVVAEGFSGSYDGKAHGITVTAPDGATVKYGTTEGTYDKIESPTITNAGDLIVYYQVTKEGYIPATGSAKVSIAKATASCTAPVAVEDLIYSGTPQTLITPAATDCGTVQYMGENGAFSSSLPTRTNAGTCYVYYKVIGDANHNDTGVLGPVEVKMDKAPLTIIAKNHTITYGDVPANNGVDYSGFVNGETASALGGTLSYSYSYEQYGKVGEYTITPAGLSSNNYEISYTKGTLAVEQKEIGIKWDNTDLTYNGKEQKPTATATGIVNGDALTLTIDGAQSGASTTGYTATVKGISGDKAGNYKLPDNVVTTFTIAKATPSLGNVSVVGTVKDTIDPTDVVLTGTNTMVDGTFALTDEKLLANVTTYHWTFTPTDTANYNVVTGEVEIDVLDTVAPSAVVTVEENQWRTTLNTITFGLFFKETKTVTIEYADNENGSGIDAMLYYVSDKAVADVANIPWKTYSKSFNIDPDGTFVIYAKAVDKDGNSAMVNSDGIVLDASAPLLKDIVDGGIYYGDLTITASDALAGVKTVTVDGDTVVLENGQYTLAADNSEHTVVVTDKAGNTQQYTVHVMKMYTVSFIVDGEILDTVTVGHGQSIGLPMIPDKAGYDQFPPYWNHNGKNITKDTEITAIYIINKYTVSGTVTSYLEADETVTIGLYVDDSTVAKYATVVTGNTVAYAIANVDFGTYTMKVSKENHVTREYTVVVDDHVTWNAEICPKGDVNLDGEVNADDLTALARHVAKIESLTDPYALLTANVDNNDMLSADDLTLLARFVAKIIPSL